LYSKEIGVQDGNKFRAVNSKDRNLTESKLQKKLELIEEKISKYLDEIDKNDAEEGAPQKYTREEIEEMLNSTPPEDMKACLEVGVLPNAYKDKGVDVCVEEVERYESDASDSES